MAYVWTPEDADAYVSFCNALGITDLSIPLKVWSNESNLDPTAHNPGGASGVFQAEPDTLRGLGYSTLHDTDLALFRTFTVAEQLVWATRFYSSMRHCLGSVAGFYCATFIPAQANHWDNPNFIICGQYGPFAWAYLDNKGFDLDGSGYIKMKDLAFAAERAFGPRAKDIYALVLSHKDTDPELPPI